MTASTDTLTATVVDLYIVGLGMGGFDRITREAEKVLRGAREILCITSYVREIERLEPHGVVTSLWELYLADDDRRATYAAIADRIVESTQSAHAHGGYACFAVPGHPLWLVNASRQAMSACSRQSLRCVVLPGVSSIDTILIDAPVDFDGGVQLLEATRFVQDRLVVDRRLPLMLFQFGDFGSERLRPKTADAARYAPLIERLTELYGADHVVHIVLSGWRDRMRAEVHSAPIRRLRDQLDDARVGTTLVVPPVDSSASENPTPG